MWRGVDRLVVECDGQRIEIRRGLVHWPGDTPRLTHEAGRRLGTSDRQYDSVGSDIAEILTVDRWLARNAPRIRIVRVDGVLSSQLPRIAPAGPATS